DAGDFGRGAAPAFDRTVHVTLPADAGVLAGEEDPSARTREPGAQLGIEGRIEKRVAAARQRIVLPHNLLRREKLRAMRAEKIDGADEALRAVLRDDRLRQLARIPAAQKRQDARRAALFLVAFPERAEGQRGAKRARPA